ncbi:MAG: DUF3795 domain-containing protein [Chloroflexota bacterium]|nr:DUF3795 domain-containing protein [Chloroflexota bacterium]
MTQEKELKELTAPCGIYCGACVLYRAMRDSTIREKVAISMGLAIEQAQCLGCRAEKGNMVTMQGQVCESYDCISAKGLDFCYECDDFPCLKLAPCADRATEIPHNTKIYSLMLIKNKGLKAAAEDSENRIRRYFRGKKPRAGGDIQMSNF